MLMKRNIDTNNKRASFFKLAFVSLIAVYVLILVGGTVRSTGSGMGCPDWPKCFGNWVPPTDVSQLPHDYKEVYAEKRLQKNLKLSRYLMALGMDEKARQVREDEIVYEEQDFNKYKTWTEYINRLAGVTIGFLVIATFLLALRIRKTDPSLVWIALGIVLLTGFQGWIGSLVVSTNLLPWMVTMHMLITFFIVAGLVYLVFEGRRNRLKPFKKMKYVVPLLILCIITLIVQVVYGTQVREGIDEIAMAMQYRLRETWIAQLDWVFYFHRSFSWVILILHGLLLWMLWKGNERFWSMALFGVIVISVLSGTLLTYMNMPAVLQPIHLLVACIAVGIQFYMLLILRYKVKGEVA